MDQTLFVQLNTKILSSTIIFLIFSTKFKQKSDPNIGLQSGCKNLSFHFLAKFITFFSCPCLVPSTFKKLLFSLSVPIDVSSLYLFLYNTIHLLLFPTFTAAIMSPSPTKGFDRTFCIRMKSTLTKRGVHVKCSGYRVRISYSKCLHIK